MLGGGPITDFVDTDHHHPDEQNSLRRRKRQHDGFGIVNDETDLENDDQQDYDNDQFYLLISVATAVGLLVAFLMYWIASHIA